MGQTFCGPKSALFWGAVTSVAGVRGARGVSILSTRFVNLSTSFYVITVFMLPFRKILNDTLQKQLLQCVIPSQIPFYNIFPWFE